jgi:2-iminoacetate synthase ThiH
MSRKSIDEEVREMARRMCNHVCHQSGLNPWIKRCPGCGCDNPKYDPAAVSDIKPLSDAPDLLGLIGLLGRRKG